MKILSKLQKCMAGLLFANESEANQFRGAVEKILRILAQKKDGKWMKC